MSENDDLIQHKVSDADRAMAIQSLAKSIGMIEESAFTPKEKAGLAAVKRDVMTLLDSLGYSTKDPNILAAVGTLIANLDRVTK